LIAEKKKHTLIANVSKALQSLQIASISACAQNLNGTTKDKSKNF
jgi:hypothetical protein